MKIQCDGWTLHDHDVRSGRQVWYMTNDDGSITWRTDYPVQPTIDINTAQRNLAQDNWKGDYHHVASIPLNIYHDELAAASQQGDDGYISKWLNDGDNRAWRTKDGTV